MHISKKGLDFDRGALQVTGKGCKDRLVPLGYISKILITIAEREILVSTI